MNKIFLILYSICKSHLIIIGILILTYFIEEITGLKLFIRQFKWKKSTKNALIHLDGDSWLYFLFVLGVFIFDIFKKRIPFEFSSVIIWLSIMIFLVFIFRKYYNKYQGVDPNKADDDYT